jgi:outer membrane biosynthesis protein TonB
LAYLDDTLEPTEIKQIGQKVAESDAAQELIARIKQITRRRRLTTPPLSGPGAANFDPNTVAEYLDNALSGDQIAEVEKLCLESDVHLAEISTCHQILTLVLGEPALVPPTARERMYGLVQGKESIPFRKAASTTPAVAPAVNGLQDDSDESPIGLAMMRRGGWARWALPAAGILLVAGLVFTLIKVLPGGTRAKQVAASSIKKAEGESPEPDRTTTVRKPKEDGAAEKPAPKEDESAKPKPEAKEKPAEPAKAEAPKAGESTTVAKGPEPTTPATPKESATVTTPVVQTPPASAGSATEKAGAPSTERREVGTYTVAPRSGPTLLVQRQGDQPWRRLTPGGRVFATDPLVSLPGYLSEVRLDSGVQLQLRGLVPQFATDVMMNLLSESSVVLHPSKDVDLDFTLNSGRVYVSNHKDQGPARIRVRFDREIWELTLAEPDTEVIVELIKRYFGDIRWQDGEEPLENVYLAMLKGKGTFKRDYNSFNLEMPGPAFVMWDNKGRGLSERQPLQRPYPQWDKAAPANKEADEMGSALEELSKRMTDKKSVDVALIEGLQSDRPSHRLLSIYCLGALDEVRRLLDVLGDEDPNRGIDRITAVRVLQRWISRGPQAGKLLFDPEKRSGFLTENRKYLTGEAETVLKLLYGFSIAELRSPDTYRVLADYLLSPRIAIRELAIGHLYAMGAPVKFNPAWSDAERQKAAAEVNKMVDDHKLPPPLKGAPGAAGAAPAGNSR